MAPLREAMLLPGMIENAKSPTTRKLLEKRRGDVRAELLAMDRAILLENARDLILGGETKVSELAPVFVEMGIVNQNSYVGVLKLALMLGDDNILKSAVEHALENGANIFEIRDVVCEEGFAQKMDVAYSVFSPSALSSYEFIFRTREKHFGREDVDGIKEAVAFLLAKEKTTKILRNEYRKKGYVKEYSQKLLAMAESGLEKIPKNEEGEICEDDFALAVYRAYFEDVCLFKNKEVIYYYLRLIENYRVRSPFLTEVIKHALENGEKRAKEKALMLIRDFKLDVDVENLRSENLNERVLALQIMLSRGWSEIFRGMLFSDFYKERKLALEAFLKYKPKINEEEEKRIRKLARTETRKCGVLAKKLLKQTPEMRAEEPKTKFSIKQYVLKTKEKTEQAFVHAMERAEKFYAGIKENSAKVFEKACLYARDAYRMSIEVLKTEKRARMVNWGKILEYYLLLATITFATTFTPSPSRTVDGIAALKAKIAYAVEEKKKEREEMISQLAQKVVTGQIPLSDALKQTRTPEELTRKLKKAESPKAMPKPKIEMDGLTRSMYEEAMGVIGVTKGLDSFEYQRGMLVDQYYSQNVGANKWINILIFGDNTAWAFPTANLGSSLSERGSVNVGDILLNHIGSAYVLSDDYNGGYLIAYHDSKNGLRIVQYTFQEIKSEFDRVLTREEANEFAKQKICEQLNLDPNNYNVVLKPLVFPVDYNCNRRWDDSLNCWVGNAHDYGAPREAGRRRHEGTDLYAPFGAPIYSPVDGVVIEAGWGGRKAGKRVWIAGVDGYYYMMAHLDSITVKVGQFVSAGTVVGKNGDTGNAKGLAGIGAAHDHQEVHKGGRNNPINPDHRLYDSWSIGLEKK
ncbi:MAG: M23 family metallopeptidase [Candidatus Anstonellales archaeon]